MRDQKNLASLLTAIIFYIDYSIVQGINVKMTFCMESITAGFAFSFQYFESMIRSARKVHHLLTTLKTFLFFLKDTPYTPYRVINAV